MRVTTILFGLLILGLGAPLSTTCAQQNKHVVVAKPWARASIIKSRPGVAYLTLRNTTAKPDRLLAVTSPLAANVMLHSSEVSNGVMTMRTVTSLKINPGQVITMQPGGMHLMLIGLREPLRQGAQLAIVLEFENAGRLQVSVPILSIAAKGPKRD